jgi:hypothetical protein
VLSALPLLERKVEETPFFFSVLLVSSGGRETLFVQFRSIMFLSAFNLPELQRCSSSKMFEPS